MNCLERISNYLNESKLSWQSMCYHYLTRLPTGPEWLAMSAVTMLNLQLALADHSYAARLSGDR